MPVIYDAELFPASSINKKVKEGVSPFLVSPKFQKRSALKFVLTNYPRSEAEWDLSPKFQKQSA